MDMNFLQQMLRLQNIFGNVPQGGPSSQDVISPALNGTPTVSQPYINPAMQQQGYQPQDTAGKSYNDFLAQYPVEQPPSKMRQLGGFLAGFGAGVSPAGYEHGQAVGFKGNPKEAMQVSDAFTHYPHDSAVNEWMQKAKPMQTAVAEEDKANANKRIAYEQDENRKVSQQKADETSRANQAKEDENQQKIGISQQRADIAAQRAEVYKEMAKGGKLTTDSTGKDWIVYKDGTKTDTGLQSLSPAELQQLKTESMLEGIKAREAATQEDIKARGAQGRETKAAPSGANEWGPAIQAFDKAGKPSGVIQINKNDGSVRTVDTEGKDIKLPSASGGAGGTTTVDKTTTGPAPNAVAGFFGAKAKETTTHTVTTKAPVTSGASDTAKRQKAIDQLKTDGHPVTEANIKYVMERIK